MTTHAVAILQVTNPDSLAQYRDKAADALAKHGGSVVQASADLKQIDGTAAAPTVMAVLQFPDRDAADAWINDPDLADVHALRRNSGNSDIYVL
ncbi:DUF1330 domain-containing protein [uncultured Tateyamaria sp.]|uniref:DUF1330 domain-containing protein n=1 Tax=uncultured Tateyamaria sp. TaxID=455651 RepID=UPI0026379557|nr:DUF1330 domain-containing protein [uncultured Tateyamaria sp.]